MAEVDPEQRHVGSQHPLGAAKDRPVAPEDDHQLEVDEASWGGSSGTTTAASAGGRQIGVARGERTDDPGLEEALDQPGRRGDRGRPAHVGEDGHASPRFGSVVTASA